LFDPQADRGLDGLNALTLQLGEESRVRLADAVTQFVVAAAQNPPQPYDAAAARQALKAAGVRAALLDDGFVAGLNGNDHPARVAVRSDCYWMHCRHSQWASVPR
jgi:hypothetical protein